LPTLAETSKLETALLNNRNEILHNNTVFPFSYREALERGTFISGMPKSGKTNLGKIIATQLLHCGYTVRCFDSSQAWLQSDIPYYVNINSFMDLGKADIPLEQSCVFDVSALLPEEQAVFTGEILDRDFEVARTEGLPNWTIYIIEEAQLVIPSGSLRSKYAQTTFRMVSVGRNFKQRFIMLTQRPADIDVKALSRVGQAYIGQHWEENDIRKLSRLLGYKFEECRRALSSLQLGEFVYFSPYTKVKEIVKTPAFVQSRTPVEWCSMVKPKKRYYPWQLEWWLKQPT